MRRLALALAALALAAPVNAGDFIKLSPAQIGEIFCIARLGNDMAPVEALLTPDLASLIADAWVRNAAWETANPGDKPPLGDGIPWQTWPDYATECTIGTPEVTSGSAAVPITYGYSGAPDATHTDVLLVRLVPAAIGEDLWRIDNLAYATEGDLRAVLASAFD